MATPKPGTRVRGSRTGKPIMALLDLLGRRWALRIRGDDGALLAAFRLVGCVSAEGRAFANGVRKVAVEEDERALSVSIDRADVRLHHRIALKRDRVEVRLRGAERVPIEDHRVVRARRNGRLQHERAADEVPALLLDEHGQAARRARIYPRRRNERDPALFELAKVALVRIPADGGERVHERAARIHLLRPREEATAMMMVVPRVSNDDRIEA